jgi:hypothetical protein
VKISKGANNELDQTPPEDDLDQDRAVALLNYFKAAHDGPGWYYWVEEYPDEGSVGAFDYKDQCAKHAHAAGYAPTNYQGVPLITIAKKREA